MLKISRTWAMPNKWTFLIPPIADLLKQYNVGSGWVDPFAGINSPAEITNDINPDKKTTHNLDAYDFLKLFDGESKHGILLDPPYSLGQVTRTYDGFGKKRLKEYTPIVLETSRIISLGGYAIKFGWNSNGVGMKYGFKMVELLIIPHGGEHNDTIVTVEQKVDGQISLI